MSCVIALFVLWWEVPKLWRLELSGQKLEGKIIRYRTENQGSKSAKYRPVLTIVENGVNREIVGNELWRFRWYDEGDVTTIIELPGYGPEIGGFFCRWSLPAFWLGIIVMIVLSEIDPGDMPRRSWRK